MLQTPEAILFDLDDTIIASGDRPAILLRLAEEAATAHGGVDAVVLADRLEEALTAYWSDPDRHKIGRFNIAETRRAIFAEVVRELDIPSLNGRVACDLADRFTALREELMDLFPGAKAAIESLGARSIRLGLITNGDAAVQRSKLARFSLTPLFDHVQIEGEVGFGKPEPSAYLHAMNSLGVAAERTWIVGDDLEWEVAAPQRLGIYAIWHDHRGRGLPADTTVMPDRIIRSLSDLLA